MSEAVSGARLEYAVFYKDGTRFPESGWLSGSAEDVAELARLASVPQEAVNSAADALQNGIEGAVAVMDEMAMLRPAAAHAIADLLGMSDVPQTRRMACAIIANAMVFHDRVAGIHEGVKPLDMVCGAGVADPKSETVAAWNHILTINYWPIFAIARDVITQIPSREAARMLERLRRTAGEVESSGASVAHDLTGRIFQRLIADRKYLATFYTLPASAALLARLAVAKMGVDWSDADAIAGLRIGDFACGTGALLSAVYERIAAMHENAGGGRRGAAYRDDGRGSVRLRRDAVGDTHNRLHAFGYAAQRRIRAVPPVHDALRTAGRRQREDRLARTAAIVVRDDAVQHIRPGAENRQRGGGDGGAGIGGSS